MESEGDEASHQVSSNPSLKILKLPPELIVEIILRLPVKSLLQYRCVSKSWRDLISSHKFIKNHVAISGNNKDCTHHRILWWEVLRCNLKNVSLSSLLYVDSVSEIIDSDYPMKYPYIPARRHIAVQIMGSVNGLICLAIEKENFFFWNPSLRKFKNFPTAKLKLPAGSSYKLMYGFGYDEIHDDCKVVVGWKTFHSYHFEVKIYSLNNDSWRSVDDFPGGKLYMKWEFMPGLFVNGKLHSGNNIIYSCRDTCSHKIIDWDIISIDLVDGKWGKVEKPCYGEGDFTSKLGVLGGNLSMFCNYQSHADVWVMEYGIKESWTKICVINRPKSPVMHMFIPLFFMSNKGELMFVFDSIFIIYNPKNDSSRYWLS
ncbi:F-box/kelch-repeat protein At3g23880-like [Lycium barbarum]|uniref:F-box/kelch-repeat protein At3g23880-like n=1 Tax=Lycium barbarum TaxID=112863 RepID=UPI00293F6F24|nr:F-box/kelch-repeat protein At3g23880-like [Lycium barbarum]